MEKELPKGWVNVELRFLGEYINGRAFKPTEWKENGLPIIRIQNLNDSTAAFNFSSVEHEPKYLVKKGELLMAWSASLGVYIWERDNAWLNQHIFKVLENEIIVTKRFLFYSLQVSINEFYKKTHGSGIVHITKPVFEAHKIPLPPLPEQQRIVAKLDTLFGHLDALKTRLERIPQLLKDFRQKVLTQAVTGKLTEEWREGKELEEWNESPLNEFSSSRLGKMLDKEKNQGIPTKYLRNINVRWFDFDLDDLFEIKVSEEEMQKYSIQDGDVLVCEGGEPGRAAIWRNGNTNIIFQKALHRIRLNNNVLPKFLLYNLKVDSVNNVLNSLFTGTTIKHLTGVAFSDYTINIPPLIEQQEIVRRVESLFAKADQIEEGYQKLKAKVEQLPQALLAKAFRGELVTQLPTDLPAGIGSEFFAYVLYCSDGSLYKGFTNNLKRRYEEHRTGNGAEHTRKYKPLYVYHYEVFSSEEEALKREKFFKSGHGREWLKQMERENRLRQAGGDARELLEEIRQAKMGKGKNEK